MHKIHTVAFTDPLNTGNTIRMAFSSEDSMKGFCQLMDEKFKTRLSKPAIGQSDPFGTVEVFDSTDEACANFMDEAKKRSFQKLTPADQIVLGLTDPANSF